jgi:hypothetical protein
LNVTLLRYTNTYCRICAATTSQSIRSRWFAPPLL